MSIDKPVRIYVWFGYSYFQQGNCCTPVTYHIYIYKLPQDAHTVAPVFNICAYFTCTYVGKDLHLAWLCTLSVFAGISIPLSILVATPIDWFYTKMRLPIPPPHNAVFSCCQPYYPHHLAQDRVIGTAGFKPTTSTMHAFTVDALPVKLRSKMTGSGLGLRPHFNAHWQTSLFYKLPQEA